VPRFWFLVYRKEKIFCKFLRHGKFFISDSSTKIVLLLIVIFIYSIIKIAFQKKEKPRRRRFANFKKICIWGLGEHQQARKGISLSPVCNRCRISFLYKFLALPIIS
jgi:hypothetical protein